MAFIRHNDYAKFGKSEFDNELNHTSMKEAHEKVKTPTLDAFHAGINKVTSGFKAGLAQTKAQAKVDNTTGPEKEAARAEKEEADQQVKDTQQLDDENPAEQQKQEEESQEKKEEEKKSEESEEGSEESSDDSSGEGNSEGKSTYQRSNNYQPGFAYNALNDWATHNYIGGESPRGLSKQLRNQANMHEKQGEEEHKSEQKHAQEANRNYLNEAGKIGAGMAAQESAQAQANLGPSAGESSVLERTTNIGDPNAQRDYQADQRKQLEDNQRKKWEAKQAAEFERGEANMEDYDYQQNQEYNRISDKLSMGGSGGSSVNQQPQKPNPPKPNDVKPEDGGGETPQPETPAEQSPEQGRPQNANPQNVINYFLGSSQGYVALQNDNDKALVDYLQKKYPHVKPVQANMARDYYGQKYDDAQGGASLWEGVFTGVDDAQGPASEKQALMKELRGYRGGGDVSKNLTEGNAVNESATVSRNNPGEHPEWVNDIAEVSRYGG